MGIGTSYASNVVKSTTNVMISQVNEASQSCALTNSADQVIIVGGPGCAIIGADNVTVNVDATQNVILSESCIQNVQFSSTVDANLAETVAQQAAAITSSLNIGIDTAVAKNTVDILNNIAIAVKNRTIQSCLSSGNASSIVEVCNVQAQRGSALVNVSSQQFIADLSDCVQNDTVISDLQAQLVENIDQKASAKVECLAGCSGAMMALFIALIGGGILMSHHKPKQPKTPAAVKGPTTKTPAITGTVAKPAAARSTN